MGHDIKQMILIQELKGKGRQELIFRMLISMQIHTTHDNTDSYESRNSPKSIQHLKKIIQNIYYSVAENWWNNSPTVVYRTNVSLFSSIASTAIFSQYWAVITAIVGCFELTIVGICLTI